MLCFLSYQFLLRWLKRKIIANIGIIHVIITMFPYGMVHMCVGKGYLNTMKKMSLLLSIICINTLFLLDIVPCIIPWTCVRGRVECSMRTRGMWNLQFRAHLLPGMQLYSRYYVRTYRHE